MGGLAVHLRRGAGIKHADYPVRRDIVWQNDVGE